MPDWHVLSKKQTLTDVSEKGPENVGKDNKLSHPIINAKAHTLSFRVNPAFHKMEAFALGQLRAWNEGELKVKN